MAARRKEISKKTRFEVFKRDSFTCQYCGSRPPRVVLHIDHIDPVANGGGNDVINLITSCAGCNAGKGPRVLSDSTVIDKRHKQLAGLQEKQEQLAMMVEWQQGLIDIEGQAVEYVAAIWSDLSGNSITLNERGRQGLRKLLSCHTVDEVVSAARKAADSYFSFDDSGRASLASTEEGFAKLPGIIYTARQEKDQPYLRDVFYIRGILKRRIPFARTAPWMVKDILIAAFEAGYTAESLKRLALNCSCWSDWSDTMDEWINSREGQDA